MLTHARTACTALSRLALICVCCLTSAAIAWRFAFFVGCSIFTSRLVSHILDHWGPAFFCVSFSKHLSLFLVRSLSKIHSTVVVVFARAFDIR